MWKSALAGIILENIETLDHYRTMSGDRASAVDNILQFVSDLIGGLPWHFRVPVITLASIIGMLFMMTTGRKLHLLPAGKRTAFLQRVSCIPFYGMLNKLVRSMAFMKLFDIAPLEQSNLNGAGFEGN
jgi:hypothetical protein